MNAVHDVLVHVVGNSPLLALIAAVGWAIVNRIRKVELEMVELKTIVRMHMEEKHE